MPAKLGLPPKTVDRCRSLAREVAAGVLYETDRFTTVATERAVARLLAVTTNPTAPGGLSLDAHQLFEATAKAFPGVLVVDLVADLGA